MASARACAAPVNHHQQVRMTHPTDAKTSGLIERLSEAGRTSFEEERRLLSFGEFLNVAASSPERVARSAVQYILDAFSYFGRGEAEEGSGLRRFKLFDAPFDEGRGRVVGNAATQDAFWRQLKGFEREGRVNRLVVIHGPNGSAKSSFVTAIARALEAYSRTDEGALYRFNWVFPGREGARAGRIGFGGERAAHEELDSFAYLPEDEIDARLPAEHNDNPIFLLEEKERRAFLHDALQGQDFALSTTIARGGLGHRSRKVFDALAMMYRGDIAKVLRHVQVERFYLSHRYRRGLVTVEAQMHVDAGVRQLTADMSLSALPKVLQSQTLFEVFGPLVEGNRGLIEFNDFLKRPLEANRYLLATGEKGTVSLQGRLIHLDSLLVGTANETYLDAMKSQPDWASYRGRLELVRMPYLLNYKEEAEIYDDLLDEVGRDVEVAPHTTTLVALWAVMTRLLPPSSEGHPAEIQGVINELSPLDKARLYAGEELSVELGAEERQLLQAAVPTLRQQAASGLHYEGRYGASPRELRSLLIRAVHGERAPLSPPLMFRRIKALIADESVYEWLRIEPQGDYHRPGDFLEQVQEVYLDLVERELRVATGLVEEHAYRVLFERYVRHANFWLKKEKVPDPVTGSLRDPDEGFMREIESRLGISDDRTGFRSQVISRVAAFRIDNPDGVVDFDRIFPDLVGKLEEEDFQRRSAALAQIYADLLVHLDGRGESLSESARELAATTLLTLTQRFGYSAATAREAIATLLSSRQRRV